MEKIEKLKKIFKREKIDGYIIPKNDKFFGNKFLSLLQYSKRFLKGRKIIYKSSYFFSRIMSENHLFNFVQFQ